MIREWLASITVVEGGVRFPGRPPQESADLLVAPDAVTLQRGGESAVLSWDDYRWGMRSTDRHAWSISYAWEGNGGIGVAIDPTLAGRRGEALGELPHRRVEDFGQVLHVVRLVWAEVAIANDGPARDTLAALLAVLAGRPGLRSRLADADRARRLARAFRAPLAARTESIGVRRATFETLRAMRALGYRHAMGGRPVAGDALPPRDEVVTRVIEAVRRNPYSRDVRVDATRVAELVDEEYLVVDPWPFAALTADVLSPDAAEPTAPSPPSPPPVPDPTASVRGNGAEAQPPAPPVPPDYGAGHRPAWWRESPPWSPPGSH